MYVRDNQSSRKTVRSRPWSRWRSMKAVVWERQGTTLKPRHSLRTNGPARVVAFDAAGERVLIGTRRGEIVIVDASTGKTRRIVRTGGKAVNGIEYEDEGTVRIWADSKGALDLDLQTGKLKPVDAKEATTGLLGGGDPNAPRPPEEPAKPEFRLMCWAAECSLMLEPESIEPVRVLAIFGVLDRPGAAFVMTNDGRVDTLGTSSDELLVCRDRGRTYPFAHCRDLVEVPGLLGRVLDEVCAQGAAGCPR